MSVNFLIGSAVACGHNTMADYEKYILTYQFSFNVCIFILYIRHISASNNFFSCNILSLLVLRGRSIWFFGVKCFCIVFHVWTCQLTTENLVMMNKVSYFQTSPLLSFLSNQDSAGETAYFTSPIQGSFSWRIDIFLPAVSCFQKRCEAILELETWVIPRRRRNQKLPLLWSLQITREWKLGDS